MPEDMCILINLLPNKEVFFDKIIKDSRYFYKLIPFEVESDTLMFFTKNFPIFFHILHPMYHFYYEKLIFEKDVNENVDKRKNKARAICYFYKNKFIDALKIMHHFPDNDVLLKILLVKKIISTTQHTTSVQDYPYRQQLLDMSKNYTVEFEKCKGTGISIKHFMEGMVINILEANKPFDKRDAEKPGIYFPGQLAKQYNYPLEGALALVGVAPLKYWEQNGEFFLYKSLGQYPITETLQSFFFGPTVWDCNIGIQANIPLSFEQMLGTKTFNKLFKNPLEALYITHEIFSPVDLNNRTLREALKWGNPFFDFFETVPINEPSNFIVEDQVQEGDIIYFQGVPEYPIKHPYGGSQGWNLLCVGNLNTGEKTYLGFDPTGFHKPLTLKELKAIAVDEHNKEPEYYGTQSARNQISEQFKAHKVTMGHAVGGVRAILRFKPDFFLKWGSYVLSRWHHKLFVELHQDAKKSLNSTIVYNTHAHRFDNYLTQTKIQHQMLKYVQKLALSSLSLHNEPRVLVLISPHTFEKTHLALALHQFMNGNGLKSIYLDQHLFSEVGLRFQNLNVFQEKDVVIFDNLTLTNKNQKNTLVFLLWHVINEKKSLLINSNDKNVLDVIKKGFPAYIGHTNKESKCVKIVRDDEIFKKTSCHLFFKEKSLASKSTRFFGRYVVNRSMN